MRKVYLLFPVAVVISILMFVRGFRPKSLHANPRSTATQVATFTVTTPSDEDDGSCDPASCSLREAINAANANPGADIVTMDENTIFGQGIFLDTTQVIISDDLTLLCGGIPFSAAAITNRFLYIGNFDKAISVSMHDCNIQGGNTFQDGGGIRILSATVTINNSYIGNNRSISSVGGGISAFNSSLTLSNTIVQGNKAGSYGGGIFFENSDVVIEGDSIISRNETQNGGGLATLPRIITSTLLIKSGVVIEKNIATVDGGGIFNSAGLVMLEGAVVEENSADNGAGIYNIGTATLLDTILQDNNASSRGGGIYNEGGDLTIDVTSPTKNRAIVDVLRNEALSGGGIYNDGGRITANNISFEFNTASDSGAGLYSTNGGDVTLRGTIFREHTATAGAGGAIYNGGTTSIMHIIDGGISTNFASIGAGVYNSGATLTIRDGTSFQSNTATNSGGNLYNSSGNLTINESWFSTGTATNGSGGNLFIQGGSTIVSRASFSRGFATNGLGGGVFAQGTLTLTQSSVMFNRAVAGAGLYLRTNGRAVVIENSTINENDAQPSSNSTVAPYGGGVYVEDSVLSLRNATVVSNTAAIGAGLYATKQSLNTEVTVANSIIAHNRQGMFGFNCFVDAPVQFDAATANLSDNATCPGIVSGTTAFERRTSSGIGNYYPLRPSSDALDTGDTATCAAIGDIDQRNAPRPFGSQCDIGAIEQGSTPLSVQLYLPLIQKPSTARMLIPLTTLTGLTVSCLQNTKRRCHAQP